MSLLEKSEGTNVKKLLFALCVAAFASGCATPPGQLRDSDFEIRSVAVAKPIKDVADDFRNGLRYCGSETGLVLVTHHGIADCGQGRSDGSMTCDMYMPQGMGIDRKSVV